MKKQLVIISEEQERKHKYREDDYLEKEHKLNN